MKAAKFVEIEGMKMEREFEHRLTEVEERSKSNTHRLDCMEKRQDEMDKLVTSVATLANEQTHIKKDVEEIKTGVQTLTEKPGKRWDAIVDKAVWAVLAAMIAFLLGKGGL